jgi:MFS family permease
LFYTVRAVRKSATAAFAWTNVVLAALLMLATLPGRTQGLGLITEPLLKDLHFDRVDFAQLNLWATLLGSAFCFPIGYVIDKSGLRVVSTALVLLLGCTVWLMSRITGGWPVLFVLILLTRALGQSALSVASITTVGKSFRERLGLAMGIYSFLLSTFFVIAFILVGNAITTHGWRIAWSQIAVALLVVIAPLILFFLRDIPNAATTDPETLTTSSTPTAENRASLNLSDALQTSSFWIFGLSTALFALVTSGLGLFNESVLAEHGFDQKTYHTFLAVTTFVGLCGQLLCGWLALRHSLTSLMGIAMFIHALALATIPFLTTSIHLWIFAALIGCAGGFVTVLFFAIWSHAYGPAHLGRIQGTAQLLTVVASAVGPLLFAKCYTVMGSYSPLLFALSLIVFVLAIAAWNVSIPKLGVVPRTA